MKYICFFAYDRAYPPFDKIDYKDNNSTLSFEGLQTGIIEGELIYSPNEANVSFDGVMIDTYCDEFPVDHFLGEYSKRKIISWNLGPLKLLEKHKIEIRKKRKEIG